MLEALIVTLREGVEAALAVGIVLAFLKRSGRQELGRWVWLGLGAAIAASIAGAVVLSRITIDEEAFEGILYLASALVVGSMLVSMRRAARTLRGDTEGRLSRALERGGGAAGWGVAASVFLLVVREGIETVLLLSAINLSTEALATAAGSVLGLALAVAFGVAFVRGNVRLDIGRFFKLTGIALGILLVQLVVNGIHELSEAGIVPATKTSMAIVGPLVRHNVFFLLAIVAVLLAAAWLPSGKQAPATDADAPANPAEERRLRAAALSARRWRMALAASGIAVALLVAVDLALAKAPSLSPATSLVPADGVVRIPVADLDGGTLQRYAVDAGGVRVRFIAIRARGDAYGTALDACEICGTQGYTQEGPSVICQHCQAAIHAPSIGRGGGCNPMPLAHTREGDALVVRLADIEANRSVFAAR